MENIYQIFQQLESIIEIKKVKASPDSLTVSIFPQILKNRTRSVEIKYYSYSISSSELKHIHEIVIVPEKR